MMDQQGEFKGKVCVTGASGYLASWLVKRLLLSGYQVRGTVRDPGNHGKLKHLWQLEGAKERLELVKAELMEEGSFDEAIMGCEGVEILDPAIKGTRNVLNSCKKNPSLNRVVLTSSSTALRTRVDFDSKVPLDESSWSSEDYCQELKVTKKHEDITDVEIGLKQITDVNVVPIDCAHGRYLCSSFVLGNNDLVSILAKRYPSLPVPERFEQLDGPDFEFNTSKL
ncbi:hypothetical protein GIB67_036907 [Kingdonia uniflora]|uniref:NAD(P)-binding domain-containing protein n=1 Tax=Kingdonia uniflora TaxID=39325 RepID=A0A7J7NVQ6_9MAGN|nr:hypothetical protein GIB67_036907 [Kingdonia uniflora]